MQTTGNLGLKKPEGTDLVDIADLNGNMDILDTAVNGKVDKITGKQLSTNDYTAAEKTKLAGIATGANNYTHPNHTGDVTSTGDGVTAIAAGVIVNADINAAAGIDATKIGTGTVTNTEFGYLDGVTSAIQTQINTKTGIVDYVRQPGYAATAGTLSAYTVTLTPAPASIGEGFGITIVPNVTNGASPTLNVNGLGAFALKDQKGVAYTAGKLLAGKPYMFRKVGTDFLADSSGGAGDALAGDIRAGKKAATDAGDIVGTLAVQTGGTVTPTASNIVKPAGIYDTAITVAGVAVPAAKVLNDTTIAGTTGTMPITYPSNGTHLTATNESYGPYSADGGSWIYLGINRDRYIAGVDWVRTPVGNLTPANVRRGVSLFGGQFVGTMSEGGMSIYSTDFGGRGITSVDANGNIYTLVPSGSKYMEVYNASMTLLQTIASEGNYGRGASPYGYLFMAPNSVYSLYNAAGTFLRNINSPIFGYLNIWGVAIGPSKMAGLRYEGGAYYPEVIDYNGTVLATYSYAPSGWDYSNSVVLNKKNNFVFTTCNVDDGSANKHIKIDGNTNAITALINTNKCQGAFDMQNW